MEDAGQEVKYDGDVVTDITSFSMVQNIFEGQKKITRSQIETLDSIIQLLVFYDNVWIVEPFTYGGSLDINSQEILNTLIQKKVIKPFPQIGSSTRTDFESQFKEIQEIIHPLTLEDYERAHSDIASDLQTYEENFGLMKHEKVKDLADLVHLDYSLIPLTANLLRANFYFKLIQQMKKESNKIVTYSPNVLRTSLVDDIIYHRKKRVNDEINRVLRDCINKIKDFEVKEVEKLNNTFYTDFELELPLLTALILDQCNSRADFLDQVLLMRDDSDAVRMRSWIKDFQLDLARGDRKRLKEYLAQLDEIMKNLEVTQSNKAKLINIISKPSWVEASSSAALGNVLPLAFQSIKEIGDASVNYSLKRDFYLLFKMRRDAEKISFSKSKFEELFNVEVCL